MLLTSSFSRSLRINNKAAPSNSQTPCWSPPRNSLRLRYRWVAGISQSVKRAVPWIQRWSLRSLSIWWGRACLSTRGINRSSRIRCVGLWGMRREMKLFVRCRGRSWGCSGLWGMIVSRSGLDFRYLGMSHRVRGCYRILEWINTALICLWQPSWSLVKHSNSPTSSNCPQNSQPVSSFSNSKC